MYVLSLITLNLRNTEKPHSSGLSLPDLKPDELLPSFDTSVVRRTVTIICRPTVYKPSHILIYNNKIELNFPGVVVFGKRRFRFVPMKFGRKVINGYAEKK